MESGIGRFEGYTEWQLTLNREVPLVGVAIFFVRLHCVGRASQKKLLVGGVARWRGCDSAWQGIVQRCVGSLSRVERRHRIVRDVRKWRLHRRFRELQDGGNDELTPTCADDCLVVESISKSKTR